MFTNIMEADPDAGTARCATAQARVSVFNIRKNGQLHQANSGFLGSRKL